MMSLILVPNCSGQMCNKIVYFVTALATAIECGRNLAYFFGEDVRRFSELHPEAIGNLRIYCPNWRRSKIVDWVCGWMEGHFHPDREAYKASSPNVLARFRARPRIFPIILWDWNFRNYAGMKRHRQLICSYLRAKDEFVVRAKGIVAKAREGVDTVVGVHVRRGDFKGAFGGRFYFSDDEYLRFMQDAERSLGRRIRFVIVSNEPVNCAFFASRALSVVNASASAPEDVVTLSECDYIMGPPSTFSGFAAYYGNKPICRIVDREQRIDVGDFKTLERL